MNAVLNTTRCQFHHSKNVTKSRGINTPASPHIGSAHILRYSSLTSRRHRLQALGGGEPESGKKGLKREEEPEEYWTSERERKGESPFKDPIAIIGILAILFPFILLAIAFPAGWIDPSGFK